MDIPTSGEIMESGMEEHPYFAKLKSPKVENLYDYLLSDTSLNFDEVCDIMDFYMKDVPIEVVREVFSDMKHAFSNEEAAINDK